MRGQFKYLGQLPKKKLQRGKWRWGKEGFVLGEVASGGRWCIKLAPRSPSDAEMRKVIDLVNEGLPGDKYFVDFLERLIEAQGEYATRRRLRESVQISAARVSDKFARIEQRRLEALSAVAKARKGTAKYSAAVRELRVREEEYGAAFDADGKMALERATLTGGAENDPRAWSVVFPVGGDQADVPYDLRVWIKDGKVLGEINQRVVEPPFAKGAGLTSKRAPYIFILVRMALSGSLKRLTRCVSCHKFKLMPRARAHAYCSRECERMYDSEIKRPTKLDQRLASIPGELRTELEMSEAWQKGSEEQKLKLISIMEHRSRLRRIGK